MKIAKKSRFLVSILVFIATMFLGIVSLASAEEESSSDVAVVSETAVASESTLIPVDSTEHEPATESQPVAESPQPASEKVEESQPAVEPQSVEESEDKELKAEESVETLSEESDETEETAKEAEESEESITPFADGEGKEVETKVTKFEITRQNDDPIGTDDVVHYNEVFKFRLEWDSSMNGSNLEEKDYFIINVPDEFKLFPAQTMTFPLKAPDGSTMATADATPKGDGSGGQIKVTFSDYVVGRENIKGSLYMLARLNESLVPIDGDNKTRVEVSVESSNDPPLSIDILPGEPLEPGFSNEVISKWNNPELTEDNNIKWRIRVNAKQADLKDVVISDKLNVDDPDIKYVPGSFKIRTLKVDETTGKIVDDTPPVEIDPSFITFNDDYTEFSYNLGADKGDGTTIYRIDYETTYKPGIGMEVKNKATLTATGESSEHSTEASYREYDVGGEGSGDMTNRIKIIKVDENDETIKLKDAKFEVERVHDGVKFTLTTDANGEATSNRLSIGKYLIKEIVAPEGYMLNEEVFEVEITEDKEDGFVLKITNKPTPEPEPETVEIKVEKNWVGEAKESVTIKLLADGEEYATVEITEAMDWEHVFTDLPKFKDGVEVEYTIDEVAIEGYTTKITKGSLDTVFIVVNTKDEPEPEPEKVEVKVTKKWVGKAIESITVNLYADGEKIDTVVITEDDDWMHLFEDLPKFNDGVEIVYTVDEDVIRGYTTTVTENETDSDNKEFVITNKRRTPPTEPEEPPTEPEEPPTEPEEPPTEPEEPPVEPEEPPTEPEEPPTTPEEPPVKPEEPKKDDDEDKPFGGVKNDYPDKPSKGTPIKTAVKSAVPKTGDNNNLFVNIAMMIISLIALAALFTQRRKAII